IEATSLWSPPPGEGGLTGEGVVVADHEGGWDVFHPDFFRPDAGVYDFIDQNMNGKADFGDVIDLDGDGVADATLFLLESNLTDYYVDPPIYDIVEPGYQPDTDWLYIDLNGNHTR